VNAAHLGAYRQPDAARSQAVEEARRAEAAEARRVVAAMKNPFHGLRPRGPGAVGLLLSAAAVVVPLVLASKPLAALAVHANGRAFAAMGVLEVGCIGGLTGLALGVAGMVKNESPLVSCLAFLFGLLAPVWSLFCAIAVDMA